MEQSLIPLNNWYVRQGVLYGDAPQFTSIKHPVLLDDDRVGCLSVEKRFRQLRPTGFCLGFPDSYQPLLQRSTAWYENQLRLKQAFGLQRLERWPLSHER